jgi:hypothetical protein
MDIVRTYTLLTMVFLPIAAVLHLAATLELPFRLFSNTKLFRVAESSALASRITCIASTVAGMLVAKTAVPTSLFEVVLLWILFLGMLGMMMGYIKMVMEGRRQWIAPSDFITLILKKRGEPVLTRDQRISSLVCGWIPSLVFTVWTILMYLPPAG